MSATFESAVPKSTQPIQLLFRGVFKSDMNSPMTMQGRSFELDLTAQHYGLLRAI
jgi:hypothetical protein